MATESDITNVPALVVGIPKWYIASLQRNSLIEDLNTALPSANLELFVILLNNIFLI